ncbi:threonine/serine exporter family protein [Limibacter armeniacum]|uniref:threonine/serine exporter family protein n=1 Tax=Limibacter armeniacum TaxID=466084 RepID=UPI002FE5147B
MMDTHETMHLAAEAGKIILENGGETYRVEETITHICQCYGIEEVDSFVTPTGIMMSVTDTEGNSFSLVKRVTKRVVNLEKVRLVNDISRRVQHEKPPVRSVREELKHIKTIGSYSHLTTVAISSTAAGFFCLLYGGSFRDFCVAFFIGCLLNLLTWISDKLQLIGFLTNLTGGAVATFTALFMTHMGIGVNEDKITIGAIMLLVPGLAITNAIRDTIAGDLVSGLSRGLEAFFVAVAISVGAGFAYEFWYVIIGTVQN